MRIQNLIICASQRWLAFTCMVFLACSSAVIGAEDDDDQGDDEQENRAAQIVLRPTTNAPAGAIGTAKMENREHDGVATAKIEIHTRGLLPGTYTVTVFNVAQDTNAVLGTFSIRSHDDDDDDDEDDGDGRDLSVRSSGEDDDDQDEDDDDGDEMEFRVPAYLASSDLGRISITNEGGVEVLSGDLSEIANLQSGRLSLRVRARAGDAAPDGSGMLTIRAHAWRGRASGTMTLRASNLPPRTDMHLVINGYDFGTVRTNSRGRLRLYRTQRSVNLFAASSVRVKSETGDNALKADF